MKKIKAQLRWNKALSLDVGGHVIGFNQLDCFISLLLFLTSDLVVPCLWAAKCLQNKWPNRDFMMQPEG